MTTSGKDFITNFRNARLNPLSSSPSLLTRGDIVKANREKVRNTPYMCLVNEAPEEKESPEEIAAKVKETAPIREQIRQVSDGKIMVDQSIYNEESLNRILNTVQKMKQQNNGNLFPGYTKVSSVDNYGDNYSTIGQAYIRSSSTNGNKNTPYIVSIKNANDIEDIDLTQFFDQLNGFHPKTPETEYGNESIVPTHELAHTAHAEAYKKSVPPRVPLTYEDKETFQNFINTHSSLRQIFHDAAKNTNFDNIVDAAKSISGYAKKDAEKANSSDKYYLTEVFAEAYSDVLYNGENANPYSKEIIRLYNDYINDYNETFAGWDDPKRDILLNVTIGDLLKNKDKFIENLRKAKLNPKWEKPRDK